MGVLRGNPEKGRKEKELWKILKTNGQVNTRS